RAAVRETRLHDAGRVDVDTDQATGRVTVLRDRVDVECAAVLRAASHVERDVHGLCAGVRGVVGNRDATVYRIDQRTRARVSQLRVADLLAVHKEVQGPLMLVVPRGTRVILDEVHRRGVCRAERVVDGQ